MLLGTQQSHHSPEKQQHLGLCFITEQAGKIDKNTQVNERAISNWLRMVINLRQKLDQMKHLIYSAILV